MTAGPRQPPGVPVPLAAAVLVVLLALVAVAGYALTRDGGQPAGGSDEALAAEGPRGSLPEGGGVVVAEADDDAPDLHLYADFQCPWCGALEGRAGADLAAAAERGEAGLTVSLRTFLDDHLDNDASSRAAEAAMCVADEDRFLAYYRQLLTHQPEAEGGGWTDAELLQHAEASGVEGQALERVRGCYEERRYRGYVQDMDQRALREGVTGTPTLLVDGDPVSEEEMRTLLDDDDGLATVLGGRS